MDPIVIILKILNSKYQICLILKIICENIYEMWIKIQFLGLGLGFMFPKLPTQIWMAYLDVAYLFVSSFNALLAVQTEKK